MVFAGLATMQQEATSIISVSINVDGLTLVEEKVVAQANWKGIKA